MKFKALFAFWPSLHPQRRACLLWAIITALLNLFDLSTYTFRFVGGYKMAMLLPSFLGLIYLLYWDKWQYNLSLNKAIRHLFFWNLFVWFYLSLAILCWFNWTKQDAELKFFYEQSWSFDLSDKDNTNQYNKELWQASFRRKEMIKIFYLDVVLFPFLGLMLGPLMRFWYRPKPKPKKPK